MSALTKTGGVLESATQRARGPAGGTSELGAKKWKSPFERALERVRTRGFVIRTSTNLTGLTF